MLSKTINTSKLKVKYVLGSYSSMKGYPTTEDVIYELVEDYCTRIAKDIKFTNVSLQKRFSLSEEKTQEIINTLLGWEIIQEINSTSAYSTYEVIKNPYE
jgi:Mg2+/Co2+ transporter CorB